MRTAKIKKGTVVVTRVETLIVDWHKPDFVRMSNGFKKGRSMMNEKFDRCFVCDWPFQIGSEVSGEVMNIVCFKGQGNKLLCTDCYKKLIGDL